MRVRSQVYKLKYSEIDVMGGLCRKTDPKIATVPKTQSRSKDQNDKGKYKVESNGKNLISLSLKASLNKFS